MHQLFFIQQQIKLLPIMQFKGSSKYKILSIKQDCIILSSKNTFNKFIYKEFRHPQFQKVKELVYSNHPALVPIEMANFECDHIMIIHKYYESTLEDLSVNQFDEMELINTLESIIKKLKQIYLKGLQYGMLSKKNITFYDSDIKLVIGSIQYPRQKLQSCQEYDYRVLGLIMVQVATNNTLKQENLKVLLRKMEEKYSQRFSNLIKCLLDPIPHKRLMIEKILEQNYSKSIEKELENIKISNSKVSDKLNSKQSKNKQTALLQSNTSNQSEYEYFQNKIQKIDEIVNQCLKRSKRLIEKSENNRTK